MQPTKDFLKQNTLEYIESIEYMECPAKEYTPLERGNSKLDRSIANFSLLPVITCGRRCKNCYDIKSLRRDTVRKKRLYNTWLSIHRRQFLKERIVSQINRSRTIKYIRIHVGGDFYSAEYISLWLEIREEISKSRPEIGFYTYTKSPYGEILRQGGINCIDSILPVGCTVGRGRSNYGPEEKVVEFQRLHPEYRVCPVTKHTEGVECGVTCTHCMDTTKVLFVEH